MTSSQHLPFHLTIRFSSSLPDLDLDVPSPQATTVLSLKHLIRARLSTRSRLRFIYQGRLLPDSSTLSSVIKPLPAPPPSAAAAPPRDDAKGKGKALDGRVQPARIYVNCSIGDELSAQDLADELSAAANLPDEPSSAPATSAAAAATSQQPQPRQQGNPSSWARLRPRGFQRLLQAGFTPSEISTLRTQFASIHAERFAPDAMPSPDTLRRMEDAWIDSNAGGAPSAAAADSLEEDMSSVLDVLIRGMMVGFFFPLGSLTWLLRSEVWSEKWRIFVGSGVVLSVSVGVIMSISGINR